jgi:hypothetical protein
LGVFVKIRNRSWFSLLTFCLTSVFLAAVAVALVLATGTLALASGQSNEPANEPPPAKTFSGLITDSSCGARHKKNATNSSKECTRECISKGAKYTLVSGEKAYVLVGNERSLDQLAGQRVEINGVLDGDVLRVSAVTAAAE